MPITGGEAIPLTLKSRLPKYNGVLLSALSSLSKVYLEKQGGALRVSNRERSQRGHYDDRMELVSKVDRPFRQFPFSKAACVRCSLVSHNYPHLGGKNDQCLH